MHRLLTDVLDKDWREIQVDHINGNTSDNRICNLRLCSCSENQINRPNRKDNTSGFTGVNKEKNYYRASICGKAIGWYKTLDEAVDARKLAEVNMFGKFSKYYEEVIQYGHT